MANGGDPGTGGLARAHLLRELEPGYLPHKVLAALARYEDSGSVAVVGHRPQLHEMVSYLLTGDAEGLRVQIKEDGAVRLQSNGLLEPSVGSLRWLLTAKALRVMGGHGPPALDG